MPSRRRLFAVGLFAIATIFILWLFVDGDAEFRAAYWQQSITENLESADLDDEESANATTSGAPQFSSDLPRTSDEFEDEQIDGLPALKFFRKNVALFPDDVGYYHQSSNPIQAMSAFEFNNHIKIVPFVVKKVETTAWCRYLDAKGEKEVAEPFKSFVFPSFTVWCKRRPGAQAMSVTAQNNTPIQFWQPLIVRDFAAPKHELVMCVAPIFGAEPKWLHLSEVFEHYQLQGVTYFFLYNRFISEYDRRLVDDYVKRGLVEVIDAPKLITNDLVSQLVAITDCLFRSRTFARWAIFADIDERLMMTDPGQTIAGYMKVLGKKSPSTASLRFPQRWIMKRAKLPEKFVDDVQVSEEMPTRKWHETSSPGVLKNNKPCSGQISCWAKPIVAPDKVIAMRVHETMLLYPGYKEVPMDPSLGFIRHYRDVHMQNWEWKNRPILIQFGPFFNTTYPAKMGRKLMHNMLQVLHRVYPPTTGATLGPAQTTTTAKVLSNKTLSTLSSRTTNNSLHAPIVPVI